MPRSWRDLSTAERFALALEFLRLVRDHPDLPVGRLRGELARAHDLRPATAEHIDGLLWFSGFIATEYRGVPPRPYRVLTPEGLARVQEGTFDARHLPPFPEWVARSFFAPTAAPPAQVLKFVHGDFAFWIEPNWKYKVYVEGPALRPDETVQPWQVPLDPSELAKYGVVIPPDTSLFAIKNRALILLDTMEVQRAAGVTRMYHLVGYRRVPMSDDAIAARLAAGRPPPKYTKHFILDPRGMVRVSDIACPVPNRRRFCVDFGSVPGMPATIDTAYFKGVLDSKAPNGRASLVPSVWS